MSDQNPSHADLARALGRVEGKVDALVEASLRRDGRYDGHDVRMSKLEGHKNVQYGVLATVASVVGWPAMKIWLGL